MKYSKNATESSSPQITRKCTKRPLKKEQPTPVSDNIGIKRFFNITKTQPYHSIHKRNLQTFSDDEKLQKFDKNISKKMKTSLSRTTNSPNTFKDPPEMHYLTQDCEHSKIKLYDKQVQLGQTLDNFPDKQEDLQMKLHNFIRKISQRSDEHSQEAIENKKLRQINVTHDSLTNNCEDEKIAKDTVETEDITSTSEKYLVKNKKEDKQFSDDKYIDNLNEIDNENASCAYALKTDSKKDDNLLNLKNDRYRNNYFNSFSNNYYEIPLLNTSENKNVDSNVQIPAFNPIEINKSNESLCKSEKLLCSQSQRFQTFVNNLNKNTTYTSAEKKIMSGTNLQMINNSSTHNNNDAYSHVPVTTDSTVAVNEIVRNRLVPEDHRNHSKNPNLFRFLEKLQNKHYCEVNTSKIGTKMRGGTKYPESKDKQSGIDKHSSNIVSIQDSSTISSLKSERFLQFLNNLNANTSNSTGTQVEESYIKSKMTSLIETNNDEINSMSDITIIDSIDSQSNLQNLKLKRAAIPLENQNEIHFSKHNNFDYLSKYEPPVGNLNNCKSITKLERFETQSNMLNAVDNPNIRSNQNDTEAYTGVLFDNSKVKFNTINKMYTDDDKHDALVNYNNTRFKYVSTSISDTNESFEYSPNSINNRIEERHNCKNVTDLRSVNSSKNFKVLGQPKESQKLRIGLTNTSCLKEYISENKQKAEIRGIEDAKCNNDFEIDHVNELDDTEHVTSLSVSSMLIPEKCYKPRTIPESQVHRGKAFVDCCQNYPSAKEDINATSEEEPQESASLTIPAKLNENNNEEVCSTFRKCYKKNKRKQEITETVRENSNKNKSEKMLINEIYLTTNQKYEIFNDKNRTDLGSFSVPENTNQKDLKNYLKNELTDKEILTILTNEYEKRKKRKKIMKAETSTEHIQRITKLTQNSLKRKQNVEKCYLKKYRKGKLTIYRLKKKQKTSVTQTNENSKDFKVEDVLKQITQTFAEPGTELTRLESSSSVSSCSHISDDTKSETSTDSQELSSAQHNLRVELNALLGDKVLLCDEEKRSISDYDKNEIKMKIQNIFHRIYRDVTNDRSSYFKFRRQTFNNCTFKNGRELYYQLKEIIKNQVVVDRAINAISCILDVGMWALNIVAQKGLVFGDLKIVMSNGEILNCNIPGTLIPQDIEEIIEFQTRAYFILVVEKESIFHKLIEENLPKKLTRPFIMITGKGFPDLNTQLFLRKLWIVMSLPVFILVDADPHGVQIMLNYRFGSVHNAHVSHHLAVPNAKWLGIYPSEIKDFNIITQPLTDREFKLIGHMLKTPYMNENPGIASELKILFDIKCKAGIEGLMKNSQVFLSEVYLPTKFFIHKFL